MRYVYYRMHFSRNENPQHSSKDVCFSPENLIGDIDTSLGDLSNTLRRLVSAKLLNIGHMAQLPVRKLVEIAIRFPNIDAIDGRKLMSVAGTAPYELQLYPDRKVFFEFLEQFRQEISIQIGYPPKFVVHGSFADPLSTPCRGVDPLNRSDLDMDVLFYWWDMQVQDDIERKIRNYINPLTFEFIPNFGFRDKLDYTCGLFPMQYAKSQVAETFRSIIHPSFGSNELRIASTIASSTSVVFDDESSDLRKEISKLPPMFPDMPLISRLPTQEQWISAGSPVVTTEMIMERI